MSLSSAEASFIAEDRSSYLSWKLYRTVVHTALVCPVRILWNDYRAYCRCWGFEKMTYQQFKDELEDHPEIIVKEGGRGKLRSVAMGVGVIPDPMTEARRMPDVF